MVGVRHVNRSVDQSFPSRLLVVVRNPIGERVGPEGGDIVPGAEKERPMIRLGRHPQTPLLGLTDHLDGPGGLRVNDVKGALGRLGNS